MRWNGRSPLASSAGAAAAAGALPAPPPPPPLPMFVTRSRTLMPVRAFANRAAEQQTACSLGSVRTAQLTIEQGKMVSITNFAYSDFTKLLFE